MPTPAEAGRVVRVALDLGRPALRCCERGRLCRNRRAARTEAKKSGTPGVISSGWVVYGTIFRCGRGRRLQPGGSGQRQRGAHEGEEPPPARLVGELARAFGELVASREVRAVSQHRQLVPQRLSACGVRGGVRAVGFHRVPSVVSCRL